MAQWGRSEATLMAPKEIEVVSFVLKRYRGVFFNFYQDIRDRQKHVQEWSKLKERYLKSEYIYIKESNMMGWKKVS